MQEVTKVARQLKVDFDRARLHSLIEGCFRRKRIPTFLRGKDLIRGTIIGILEKSYDFEMAVEKATQKCRLNGYVPSKQEAMYDMAECFINGSIDPSSPRQDDIIRIEKILEGIEKDDDHLIEGFVQEGINGLLYDIRKVFCYTTTMEFLKEKNMNMAELSSDIIKNMVFKKQKNVCMSMRLEVRCRKTKVTSIQ